MGCPPERESALAVCRLAVLRDLLEAPEERPDALEDDMGCLQNLSMSTSIVQLNYFDSLFSKLALKRPLFSKFSESDTSI